MTTSTGHQHLYQSKCACGTTGTVVLSVIGAHERVYIGPRSAYLFRTGELAVALHEVRLGCIPSFNKCPGPDDHLDDAAHLIAAAASGTDE